MRYFPAILMLCLPLATVPAAMAQQHPQDRNVSQPGGNSPSSIERAQPYSRKTEPLPEQVDPARQQQQPDQPLTKQPAGNKSPDRPGMSTNHQTLRSPSALH
ncbi:hypothetical protein KOEU_11530 [Komagataeibacter europaeus]|uniref:Uncharacterized protein n=1 Tax=Komagataeibacter europaeus TaxID=33995 RepID=A0A0M0EJ76_KOMEU|nr:hypothetical protein [Komagataeibacter europaeus]KON65313.1 hypothetical protein KOEU_11530 [Komagataeibacter europaeus]